MSDAYLAHYGKKGMKWGVRKSVKGSANTQKNREANWEKTKALYRPETKHNGRRIATAILTTGATVAYNYQRSAGYSKGASFATTALAGPLGNIAVAELSARKK